MYDERDCLGIYRDGIVTTMISFDRSLRKLDAAIQLERSRVGQDCSHQGQKQAVHAHIAVDMFVIRNNLIFLAWSMV